MTSPSEDFKTPGQLIQGLLDAKGWNQTSLALVLHVDRTVVAKLVADKRAIDAEMALLLGEVFGVPPERFLDLQNQYSLALARVAARPDPSRAMRAHLLGALPIAEMTRRGWLEAADPRDLKSIELALMRFFNVESVEEIEILPHAPKKTNVSAPATPVQLAWIQRVRQIAQEMIVARYSPTAVRSAIPSLKSLLGAVEEARKVPRILAECGIRFVIVESLSSAKIDGVTFWLNDFSPVIGMTLRHDRLDNFWFVLRHEMEHVLRRDGREAVQLDFELEGVRAGTSSAIPEEERAANEAASDFCVPRKNLEKFIAKKAPFFATRDIQGFSKTLSIHPAIIAGQLQHHLARYDRFRDLQVKIRSIVTRGAMVDGWGDVAPLGT